MAPEVFNAKSRVLTATLVGLMAWGLLAPSAADATAFTINLDFEFSGATAPEGATPWASATFDDSFGGANTVRLTMTTQNLVDTEFLSDWYFNFDPSLDATLLSISAVDVADLEGAAWSANTGTNLFQADGDGKFDIAFDFPPPPGAFGKKFTGGEELIFDLTYDGAISASSFDFQSEEGGGQGTYASAAHVQGIGAGGADSGWIGPVVPEPSTGLLLGLGLLSLVVHRRRR